MRPRILTHEEADELAGRIFSLVKLPLAQLTITSQEAATTEFARGDADMASETVSVNLLLVVADAKGRRGGSSSTRFDDAGLSALVADAESAAAEHISSHTRDQVDQWILGPQRYAKGPELYFESALPAMAPDVRAGVVHAAIDAADRAGLIGAGDLVLERTARAQYTTKGLAVYERATYGELSMTARTKDGTGSGWAWSGYEDWARVATDDVIARAVALAERSARPVAVEPGRYTVILEPAAVATLVGEMTAGPRFEEWTADAGESVYSRDPRGGSKIGLQMLDRRLWLVSDPWDPELPASTIGANGEPLAKVEWFRRGVLEHLVVDREYARRKGRGQALRVGGFRLFAEGPAQTLDEMIASTRRGIWVHRLSHVIPMNERTLLLTGTARDGTFLIENGRITKAIKNFRFTESPFFALSRLEAWGEPARASRFVVAPRLKVRDFDFTSLSDAI